jgi:hypothetical protein
MKSVNSILDLKDEYLSEVIFVMDYIQFGFSGPKITVYSAPRVEIDSKILTFPECGCRDALCSFIGKNLEKIDLIEGSKIVLFFSNGKIIIPLDLASQSHGEAAEFLAKAGNPRFYF